MIWRIKLNKLANKYSSLSIELKAAFWFLICSLIQKGIAVVFTPVFTRLMTTEQFGEFNVYTSWKDIFVILITLKIGAGAMGPGLVKNDRDKDAFSSSMHVLTTVLVLVWACLFFVFNGFFKNITKLSQILLYIMLIHVWTQGIWEMWAKEQRIKFHYRLLVFITLIVAIIRPIIGIIVVIHAEDKATARIIEMATVDLIAYFGLFVYTLFQGKKFFSKQYWKYSLKINIPLIPHFLSQTILNNSDRIMIERIVDTSSSGIYSLAYQISIITVFLNNALLQAMSPWTFLKLKKREESAIPRIGYTALLMVGAINLLFIALAPELIAIFAPSKYGEALWIVPPITMSVFFQFSYLLFADIELYFEKTKLIALATVIGAVLNVALNYVFIGLFGYYAAGYTTLVCYMIIAIIHYFAMKVVCNSHLDGKCVYKFKTWIFISLAFLAFGFLLLFSYSNIFIRYSIIIALIIVLITQKNRILTLLRSFLKERKSGGTETT